MFFRLNPECYFIMGEKCGAIFDLIDAAIYVLSKEEAETVLSCEKNNPVREDEKSFLLELRQFCLGNFYTNKIYIQKLRIGSPVLDQLINRPPELFRAFLEINNSCNRECWFCGYHGTKRSLGCMGCNRFEENGEPLTLERWKELIDQLVDLECENIFITGGDLTLAWEKTMSILDYASGKFTNIYIILHQQSVSIDIMNDLADRAKVIIQAGKSIDNYFENSIYILTISPDEWINNQWNIKDKNTIIDFAISDPHSLTSDLPIMSKMKMSSALHQFMSNTKFHPCLGHTVAIGCNGDVAPCPMMKNHNLGNLRDMDFHTIFGRRGKGIYKFWELTLDKINKCNGCEFRYACIDCRALEENLTGIAEGKMLCSYNPKEGKWI
ncbi:radical SAM protein [Methanothrix soehngenii]|jgi:radical SAM protein with 4Fe4S-binding SPASM domain|uniref:radical SAM protein n=1 Tax=Methanothrix soehngenii TaxID=2223 RepID=UPI002FDB0144